MKPRKPPKKPTSRPRKPKAAAAAPTPPSAVPAKTLVLRTCDADLVSRGTSDGVTWAFPWPRQGPVECPDWDPTPTCGHGLHGLPWGHGDWSYLSKKDDAIWQVVEVETALLVKIDEGKSKFPRGVVVFSGSRVEATISVLCGSEAFEANRKAAEDWSEKCGTSSTAASSGHSSTAASSGHSSTAASSGHSSTAASSGDSSTAASSGHSGIAASIGNAGQAKAGPNGLLIVTYWSEAEKRYRACVGNVGEGRIEADTWYRVTDGKLVKA